MSKSKIISIIILEIVLSLFFCGCSNFDNNEINSDIVFSDSQKTNNNEALTTFSIEEKRAIPAEKSEKAESVKDSQDNIESTIEENKYICWISVRCDNLLCNLDKLDKSKHHLIPKDGIIYESEQAEFQNGESAFDLLLREMKENKIHLEFVYTPQFESTYVEGIGNLYEFDCGTMSGWIYKVNGEISSCGCSQYILKNNDYIEWIYMCEM